MLHSCCLVLCRVVLLLSRVGLVLPRVVSRYYSCSFLDYTFEFFEKIINFQYLIIKARVLFFFLISFYLVRCSHEESLSEIFKKISTLQGIDHNIENNVYFFSWLLFKSSLSTKQLFSKNSQNSQENTGSGISLLKRLLQAFSWTLFKKRLRHRCSAGKFAISLNANLEVQIRTEQEKVWISF